MGLDCLKEALMGFPNYVFSQHIRHPNYIFFMLYGHFDLVSLPPDSSSSVTSMALKSKTFLSYFFFFPERRDPDRFLSETFFLDIPLFYSE